MRRNFLPFAIALGIVAIAAIGWAAGYSVAHNEFWQVGTESPYRLQWEVLLTGVAAVGGGYLAFKGATKSFSSQQNIATAAFCTRIQSKVWVTLGTLGGISAHVGKNSYADRVCCEVIIGIRGWLQPPQYAPIELHRLIANALQASEILESALSAPNEINDFDLELRMATSKTYSKDRYLEDLVLELRDAMNLIFGWIARYQYR